jgi:hypothetical protein
VELENRLAATQEQTNTLLDLAESWEFQYLNHYYVYNTKRLLYRLVQRGPTAAADLIGMAQLLGIPGDNLVNTINALREHGMIEIGEQVVITPVEKARRFLERIQFRDLPSPEVINAIIRAAIGGRAAEGPPAPPPTGRRPTSTSGREMKALNSSVLLFVLMSSHEPGEMATKSKEWQGVSTSA